MPVIDETTEKQINAIMDGFNFHKVHKAMRAVGWKWSGEIPSEADIRKKARQLLQTTVEGERYRTGGLSAEKKEGYLILEFVLEDFDTSSDWDGE